MYIRRLTLIGILMLCLILPGAIGISSRPLADICGYGAYTPFGTGFCISNTFSSFWQRYGNVPIFGLPIRREEDEKNQADGKIYLTQWYERQRLESHPEKAAPYNIELGLLGAELLLARGKTYSDSPPGPPHYYPQTHHAVDANFWFYWSHNGLDYNGDGIITEGESLGLFGYPISDAQSEPNDLGQSTWTQWFQRARLEYYPNNSPESRVLGGRLAAELQPLQVRFLANGERQRVGVAAWQINLVLNASSLAHANYLARNYAEGKADPYRERLDRPGFTGEDVAARARRVGYVWPVEELVAFTSDPNEAVRQWLANPRDRNILLRSDLIFAGVGYSTLPDTAKVIVVDVGVRPDTPFGVGGAMRWPTFATFGQPAAAAAASGAGWSREDFVWNLIEPHENDFRWAATDGIVNALTERKLGILGILSYSVGWATPFPGDGEDLLSFYPPDRQKYEKFVKELVTHYRGKVAAWEVWNEPSRDDLWRPKANAQEYAELLKTAYGAIKSADPGALVLTGGLSGNAAPFLEDMLAVPGAADSFDVLALHPYAQPRGDSTNPQLESSPTWRKLDEVEMRKYRALLERHRLNRPIWATEVGWPATDPVWNLSPELQADYLVQGYAQLLGSGIARQVFWYSFKDDGPEPQKSFGLLAWGAGKEDLTPRRPAFTAYMAATNLLNGARALEAAPAAGSRLILDFESPLRVRKFITSRTKGSGDQASVAATWQIREVINLRTLTWTVGESSIAASGSMVRAGGIAHSGNQAAKLTYTFTKPKEAKLILRAPTPIPIPGEPTRIGIWVLGDSSGNDLQAEIRDAEGEQFNLRFGAVDATSAGWRYYEAPLNRYFFTGEIFHYPEPYLNRKIDYPIQLIELQLTNAPELLGGSGTILLDDLLAVYNPDLSQVRFARPDGSTIVVAWAPPERSTTLTVPPGTSAVNRDGQPINLGTTRQITITSSPVYLLESSP